MTAHDPRVTLTEAEEMSLRLSWPHATDGSLACSCGDCIRTLHSAVERIIAARLAPIRALAEKWEAKYGTCGCPTNGGEQLRAALEATGAVLSASQDHDGAEGQGEGEKPADRRCPTCGIPFAHYTHDPQGRPL